ncbi:unnamed protein product [Prorocentrum cordatum]|uniref:Uncharacterized protein n=1 Tax=Prorocentrum cordatum TaxID=2364126 RepID=A0ABN9RRF9_9DINO|nr:unnamed protein product [Polarella glacialis]
MAPHLPREQAGRRALALHRARRALAPARWPRRGRRPQIAAGQKRGGGEKQKRTILATSLRQELREQGPCKEEIARQIQSMLEKLRAPPRRSRAGRVRQRAAKER